MRDSRSRKIAPALAALACALCGVGCEADEPREPDGDEVPPQDPRPPEPESKPVRETTFAPFEAWASPIDDYLAVGQEEYPGDFYQAIHDLAPLGDRMFFGYGDATFNMGEHIAIELRYFASPDDPATTSALVAGEGQGAPQTSPYQTGEEQIDRFRVLDGVLWQAGIDSIDPDELHTQATTDPKSIQGNVYRLDGDTWQKRRSITGGEHVHDVARWGGATFAVGSGADTRIEFEAGRVFRYLWRSDDLGDSFSTVQRVEVAEAGQGDTRWVTMLPLESGLYLFGYESDFATNSAALRNAVYDGTSVSALEASEPLGDMFPDDVLVLPDGTAILYGLEVGATVRFTAVHVAPDGSTAKLSSLEDSTVLDAALTETGEIVYLVMAGDEYGADPPETYDLRILAADAATPDTTTEVLRFSDAIAPASVAFWEGALFLGTGDGRVLKAVPAPSP